MGLSLYFRACAIGDDSSLVKILSSISYYYRYLPYREGIFRQLMTNISYFKFTFGVNFHIVWYARIQCSIVQKFSFGFNFHTQIHMKKTSPTVINVNTTQLIIIIPISLPLCSLSSIFLAILSSSTLHIILFK